MKIRATALALLLLIGWTSMVQGMPTEELVFEKPPYIDAAKAISAGDAAMLEKLIGQGLDVNYEGRESNTPWGKDTATLLIWAVYWNKPQAVEMLLKAGADPNKAGQGGVTPLMVAVPQKNDDIFEMLLLRYKADPNKVAIWHTALTVALDKASEGQIRWERAETLLKHGADINVDLDRGMTPVLHFTIQDDYPAVTWLLEHGANFEARDSVRATMMCYLRDSYRANTLKPSPLFDARDKVRDWLLAHGVARSRVDPALHPNFGCED